MAPRRPVDGEELRPPKPAAERVKASRLRSKLAEEGELGDNEMAWLESYEGDLPKPAGPENASASKERVVHIEERSAAAQGNHPHPEMYAAFVTAQGLRADTLLRICTQAMIQSNAQYQAMTQHLLERTTRIEDAHVAMLETVREHYLGRVEAEAEARMLAAAGADGEGGDMAELVQLLQFALEARKQHQANGKKKPAKKSRKPLGSL